jgi:hypothetical protein
MENTIELWSALTDLFTETTGHQPDPARVRLAALRLEYDIARAEIADCEERERWDGLS